MDERSGSATPDEDDDEFGLPPRLVEEALEAVEADDVARLDALLDPLHPADIADLLEQIGPGQRRDLLALWKGGVDGDILSELDESLREEVIEGLGPGELAEAVRELETDDVVDLVEDLAPEAQEAVLGALAAADRVAVEKALTYPEYSAGRLMQSEVVRAPSHWTVGEAIDFLRSGVPLPDQFYHVVLIDPRLKPVGYATLGRLLSSRRETPLRDITEDSFRTFHVEDEQGDVARTFEKYHLISVPVVDDDDRLVGVVTIDDAMTVLDEEHEEDILRLAGVGEGALSDSVIDTVRGRLPWLVVNLGTAGLAALVISRFTGTIQALVALATLMPIVASMGGNAGTQSLTVAVRALATRDLTRSNAWRVIRREAAVGLVNGLVLALALGGMTMLLFGSVPLGLVIASALVVNLFAAALAGVFVPLLMERIGVDPALASGTFVTTVTDVVGFFAFLGLATVVLL
ncbi:magnesium transporter [Rubellimicrobium aerolatum]|uniref:Magnesium transporter MgtE n=1 Tax=Rubellimicrobium aerolatum TaxID=490979 RepID=A0ABW0SC98_9RHOB|nr:magnesium transporter [Rubellimicrobium aerolatum]MBP1806247.1 magnesium transporter [Rubellimicrobium aerolatum]